MTDFCKPCLTALCDSYNSWHLCIHVHCVFCHSLLMFVLSTFRYFAHDSEGHFMLWYEEEFKVELTIWSVPFIAIFLEVKGFLLLFACYFTRFYTSFICHVFAVHLGSFQYYKIWFKLARFWFLRVKVWNTPRTCCFLTPYIMMLDLAVWRGRLELSSVPFCHKHQAYLGKATLTWKEF